MGAQFIPPYSLALSLAMTQKVISPGPRSFRPSSKSRILQFGMKILDTLTIYILLFDPGIPES
jgi:hypothetical protein